MAQQSLQPIRTGPSVSNFYLPNELYSKANTHISTAIDAAFLDCPECGLKVVVFYLHNHG